MAFFGLGAISCNTTGTGSVGGVGYKVSLEGSYEKYEYNADEHAWMPSDDAQPIVSIHITNRPRALEGGKERVMPCEDSPPSVGGSAGGLLFVKEGGKAKLKAFTLPGGVAVMIGRCVPPGERTVMCTASYQNGEMSAEQRVVATRVCKSLTLTH